MSVRTARAANVPASDLSRTHMSIARNINERNVGKSRRRSVGRCLGLIEIEPEIGSMNILCRLESAPAITMSLVEPGAARY